MMKNIKIEVFPAKHGDSFLITCFDEMPIHILVDMGFADTYRKYIKDRLITISQNGGKLDLLVFTHIDVDHIQGGIAFLKENGGAEEAKIIQVGEIWYNAYRHISPGRMHSTLSKKQTDKLEAYAICGIREEEFLENQPIGGRKGSVLGALILKGNYNWNKQFANKAIYMNEDNLQRNFGNVIIELLSPNEEDLARLEKEWKRKLEMLGFDSITSDPLFDDAFEVMTSNKLPELVSKKSKPISAKEKDLQEYASEDVELENDAVNSSCISFILEFNNKRLLFLADAPSRRICENLKQYYNENLSFFDAIKISHHGSSSSTDNELLRLIDSNNFIISTNGNIFNHPDIETIAKIVCRKVINKRNLFFNYKKSAVIANNSEWKEKYQYEVNDPNGNIVEIEI